jgi:hypothetical protein
LQSRIQGTRHAIKFISGFVLALLKVRSSNLSKIAVAFETSVEFLSTYRQIQRFLGNWRAVKIDYLGLLKIEGKLKVAIDRTEWKFGKVWINILTVSVVYQRVAIPIVWQTLSRKGNGTAAQHIEIIKKFILEVGKERIEKIFGDREFGSRELLEFLLREQIDFGIRLKVSHLANGISFQKRWRNLTERVKLKGKRSVEVFGLEIYVSCVKLKKGERTEYLIVASRARNKDALAEYKLRWGIETMFGCLKSRGFELEETHLTDTDKISKLLMLLALALCLAILTGEIKIQITRTVRMKLKNNGRYAKSLFRIGLDALQNILFNIKLPDKIKTFNILLDLLSCA